MKLLAVIMVMVSMFSTVSIPASAVTNGSWNTGYGIIKNNGKATANDSYHIYSSNCFVARKVYIKAVCGGTNKSNSDVKKFYNDISFTVRIYTTNGKLKETETVKAGGYFTMPRTAVACNYKVVITKNVPKNIPYIVKTNYNFLNYAISKSK